MPANRRHFANVRRLRSKRWQASYWHNGARDPHAERRGLVVCNVAALALMPLTKPPVSPRSFTPVEAQAVLAAAKGERLEAMVVIGLAVGLRPGELTGLLWSDLDLKGTPPTLTVSGAMKQAPDGRVSRGEVKRSKDGRRTIALHPSVVIAIRSHRGRQLGERLAAGSRWQEQGLVLCSEVGTPLNPSYVRRTFARIAKRAGIEGADFHRHKVRPVADLATRMESILTAVDSNHSRT